LPRGEIGVVVIAGGGGAGVGAGGALLSKLFFFQTVTNSTSRFSVVGEDSADKVLEFKGWLAASDPLLSRPSLMR